MTYCRLTPALLDINYNLTFADMINAGNYDWVTLMINDIQILPTLTQSGVDKVEYKLFHFTTHITTGAIRKRIKGPVKNDAWKLAAIEHLLAYGCTFPYIQTRYPLVALGTSLNIGGHDRVPYLGTNMCGRFLSLVWLDNDWGSQYRFLAIRNI
jgi:hypothetical protein